MVSKYSKNKEAAIEFVKYLTSPELQKSLHRAQQPCRPRRALRRRGCAGGQPVLRPLKAVFSAARWRAPRPSWPSTTTSRPILHGGQSDSDRPGRGGRRRRAAGERSRGDHGRAVTGRRDPRPRCGGWGRAPSRRVAPGGGGSWSPRAASAATRERIGPVGMALDGAGHVSSARASASPRPSSGRRWRPRPPRRRRRRGQRPAAATARPRSAPSARSGDRGNDTPRSRSTRGAWCSPQRAPAAFGADLSGAPVARLAARPSARRRRSARGCRLAGWPRGARDQPFFAPCATLLDCSSQPSTRCPSRGEYRRAPLPGPSLILLVVPLLLGPLALGRPAQGTAGAQEAAGAKILRVPWGEGSRRPSIRSDRSGRRGQRLLPGLRGADPHRRGDEHRPGRGRIVGVQRGRDGVTFRLRDDLTYSDGTPLTAERFRYAIERACDPQTAAPRRATSSPSPAARRSSPARRRPTTRPPTRRPGPTSGCARSTTGRWRCG